MKDCGKSTSGPARLPAVIVLTLLILSRSRYCNNAAILSHSCKWSVEGRIKNVFHCICNEYTVLKISSVETYWPDDSETDKPLLEAVEIVELLRCHWVTDTDMFNRKSI